MLVFNLTEKFLFQLYQKAIRTNSPSLAKGWAFSQEKGRGSFIQQSILTILFKIHTSYKSRQTAKYYNCRHSGNSCSQSGTNYPESLPNNQKRDHGYFTPLHSVKFRDDVCHEIINTNIPLYSKLTIQH